MFNEEEFGKRVKALRNQKGYTQETLGGICGVTREYIGRLERAVEGPSIDMLILLSEEFSVSVDYLLFGRQKTQTDIELLRQKVDELRELVNRM